MLFLFTSLAWQSLQLKNMRSWDITLIYQNCLSPDHKILSNFFIIHRILFKFSRSLYDAWMQICPIFGHYRLSSSGSCLRLTAKGHLELSDFLQSWWAVVYWDPQQVYQVWSKSGENWKKFTCNFGEGAVRSAALSEGRSFAAGASRSLPSPIPLLPCS